MGQDTRFTNLYIKNFGEELSDEGLNELFGKYGKIVSAVVMKDRMSNKPLGYGFVSFEDHASAQDVSYTGDMGVGVIAAGCRHWRLCTTSMCYLVASCSMWHVHRGKKNVSRSSCASMKLRRWNVTTGKSVG